MIRAAICGAAIFIAAATLTAGCSAAAPQQGAGPRAGGVSAQSAITGAERRVNCAQPPPQPTALPAGFAASAAVLCLPALSLAGGHGHGGVAKRIADRGLAPLIAALRRPSARPSPGVICPVQLIAIGTLFLIDRDGHIIRPVIPAGECGQPQAGFLDALRHLPWVTT